MPFHATRRLKIKPLLALALALGFTGGTFAASGCKGMNGFQTSVTALLLGGQGNPVSSEQFNPGDQVRVALEVSSGTPEPIGVVLNWGAGESSSEFVRAGTTSYIDHTVRVRRGSHQAAASGTTSYIDHTVRGESFYMQASTGGTTIFSVVDLTLECTPAPVEFSSAGPAVGAAGDEIVITGAGFYGVSQVLFGSTPVAPTIRNSTEMVVIAPAGTESVPLTLVNEDGIETQTGFRYTYAGGEAPIQSLHAVPALSPWSLGCVIN